MDILGGIRVIRVFLAQYLYFCYKYMSKKRKIFRDNDIEAIKDKGNACFLTRDYSSAITYYTAAIRLCSSISVIFSNRSRCYFMLKDYENSLNDALRSTELNQNNLKGHLLQIRSLANLSKMSLDLTQAKKSLEHCKFVYQYANSLNQPEFSSACVPLKQKIKVLIFVKKLEIFNQKVSRLKNYYKKIVNWDRTMNLLNKFVIEKSFQHVSDNFLCPITLEIFKNPVITQCGNSYEVESLVSHFSKMGTTDPIGRISIEPTKVYRNLAVINSVKWLHKNQPWTQYSEAPLSSIDIEI